MLKHYTLCAVFALLFSPLAFAQLSFTNSTASMSNTTHSGGCMGVVDLNGDGRDDIAKMHLSKIFQVDYQNADGTFTLVDYGMISDTVQWGMTIGDIANNGHKDLISGGRYDGVHFLQIPAVGTASMVNLDNGSIFMQCNNIVDIDNDGHNDFFACHDHAAPKIWMNDGDANLLFDGTVMDFTTNPPSDMSGNYGSVWIDFDNDGDLDLYIAKCKQGVLDMNNPLRWNQLFVNDGNGNFTEMAEQYGIQSRYQSWTADFGDIDNDGDLDLVITNHDHTVQLFENDGTGNYTEITVGSGLEVSGFFLQSKFVDFDNDGYLDLILAGGIQRFFKNNGDKTFTLVQGLFPAGKAMHSFAIGDLNNDGFMDVFAGYGSNYVDPDLNHTDRLWLNDGNDNNWLSVRLQGTQSNRDAIGARVTITGPWGTQIREVRAGESYGIVTTFACNFGLGQHTTIPTMVVDWPSGLQDVFTNVSVNQIINIIEGVCVSPNATITFPGANILCTGGGAVSLEAPAGFNYSWSTGENSQNISVDQPGNYTLTIDDGGICTGTTSVFIPLDPDQTPAVSPDGMVMACAGDLVELSTGSNLPLLWSTGSTGQSILVDQAGTYSVTATGTCADFTSELITVEMLASPEPTSAADAYVPLNGQALLTAAGDNVHWFDQPEGGAPLATGNEFQTPPLLVTTSYWVADVIVHEGDIFYGGREDNSPNGSYHTNTNFFLLFDAYEPMLIRSVKVYANGSGPRTIALLNQGDGSTIVSNTFNIPDGESRVQLDFTVPASGSYGLRAVGGNPQLWRDPAGSGVSYPYPLGDLGAITSSTAGENLYYFFYDWEISRASVFCESPRTEVVVNVGGVGIEAIAAEDGLRVWPNPASVMVTIAFGDITGDLSVDLIDVLGRTVITRKVNGLGNNGLLDLDVSGLAPGDYLVRVQHSEGAAIRHVIIN